MDTDDEAMSAYTSYITNIIKQFVAISNPNISIKAILPAIKSSAAKIIEMKKSFIEVVFMQIVATLY